MLIRSLQRTISKRKPAAKKIGGKRQSPSFFPGIEFDTTKAINRQSGNLARIVLNISSKKVIFEEKIRESASYFF